MKRFPVPVLLIPLVLFIGSCGEGSPDPLGPTVAGPSPEPASAFPEIQTVPGDWIVLFRPGVADPPGLARRMVEQAGGTLRYTYEHTIRGFAATLPPEALQGIRNNPNVERVEPDAVVTAVEEVPAASWGLDRIDQHALPLSGTYEYDSQGAGVDAYIIDTGIRVTHSEFGGRAVRSSEADFLGGEGDDCHGHGTHVAGIVGGANYGVARSVSLYAVRVLDCDGQGAISGVIAGVDWVTARHQDTGRPSVANMSLAARDPFGFLQALNDAVAASVDAGVVYAVAAANDDADACYYVPASEPQALTVGATGSTDIRASFSNFGYCLDLFAPGVAITSAFNTSDDALQTWSGTSMASPHVAGVAALYLGENRTANPTTVKFHIITKATEGVVGDPGTGSPNKLLYSLITRDAPTPPPPEETPAAPSDLVAAPASASQIDLSWTDNASNEEGFEVERSPEGPSSGFAPIATLDQDSQGYSDTGLSAETTYWYRVRAINTIGPSDYSNVAQATTDAEPPPSTGVGAMVWQVSDVDVAQTGKFIIGTVLVAVTEADNFFEQLPGVTVAGDWYLDGEAAPRRSSSGVTDELGSLILTSGRIKGASSTALYFCVTSLSGSGINDLTDYPACSPGFTPPDPGTPPDPPSPGVPSGLTASWSTKGGGRVELTWTSGGGAEVDVFRDGGIIATTADNGHYNDRNGEPTSRYELCLPGAVPGDADLCTGEVPVGG